jgi:hypothetical protein
VDDFVKPELSDSYFGFLRKGPMGSAVRKGMGINGRPHNGGLDFRP